MIFIFQFSSLLGCLTVPHTIDYTPKSKFCQSILRKNFAQNNKFFCACFCAYCRSRAGTDIVNFLTIDPPPGGFYVEINL